MKRGRSCQLITACWIQSLAPLTHLLTKVQKSKAPANNCIMHILTCGERISINAQEGEGEDLEVEGLGGQCCVIPQCWLWVWTIHLHLWAVTGQVCGNAGSGGCWVSRGQRCSLCLCWLTPGLSCSNARGGPCRQPLLGCQSGDV